MATTPESANQEAIVRLEKRVQELEKLLLKVDALERWKRDVERDVAVLKAHTGGR